MTTPENLQLQQELTLLRAQNAKLRKINQALIERVEAIGSTSPYAAFEHAATLSEQVRERTALQQQALVQKSMLLQHTVDNLAQGVALVDPQGLFQLCNQQFLQLTQLSTEQFNLPLPAEQQLRHSAIAQLYSSSAVGLSDSQPNSLGLSHASQQRQGGAISGIVRPGQVLTLEWYELTDGSTLYTLTDISEQYRYTEALRASERWIRTITDHIPAMIAYLDADLCFRFTNQGYDEFYGVKRGSLLAMPIAKVHSQAALTQLKPHFAKVLAGETTVFEVDEANHLGEIRCLLKSYVPNFVSNPEESGKAKLPVGFFVLIRDITERKQNSAALQQANIMLEQRVLERTHDLSVLNQQLLAAKKLAEQANQSKSKFLAAISHDLLQPLNAARLFNGSLAEQEHPPKAQHLVSATARSLDNVAQLLASLVEMSRLEAQIQQVEWSEFSIGELLSELVSEFSLQATRAQQQLTLLPCTLWVRSDRVLLSRILRNLLSNALRYTPTGGRIVVGVRRARDQVKVQVIDNGVGISATDHQIIFNEFKRLQPEAKLDASEIEPTERSMVWQEAGLGLGLAIVQKTAALLQHPVMVQSQLGKGALFAIHLPKVVAPASSKQNAAADTYAQTDTYAEAQAQTFAWWQPFAGKRIWVIDNSVEILQAMQALLGQWGCEVLTAVSEADLKQKLAISDFMPQLEPTPRKKTSLKSTQLANQAEAMPDLLIVDYQLDDGCSGVELAQALLQSKQATGLSNTTPVLVISADATTQLQTQLQTLGFHFLAKPVAPVKLKALLIHLLRQK